MRFFRELLQDELNYISENVFLTEIKGRGYTQKDLVDKDNGAISLGPSNIIKSKLNLDKCTYISWNKYHESPEIIINKNDVVLCKTGSVGKCNHPITLNPQLIVFKNIEYLHLCLIKNFRIKRQCWWYSYS